MLILLGLVGFCLLLYFVHTVYQLKKKEKLYDQMIQELVALCDDMMLMKTTSESDIKSPMLLSSLITVMVKKNHDLMRISREDFENVGEGEYVSVYVDTETHEILLKLARDDENTDMDILWTSRNDEEIFH